MSHTAQAASYKYKVSEKIGPQEIDIISPALINILEAYLKKYPDQKYLLMRKGKSLNDTQIREIVRTEIGSKDKPFGIRMILRLFATFLIKEKETNPRQLEQCARKMGTSVQMLMSNNAQVPDNEDNEEYKGHGDLSEVEEEEEEPRPKKHAKKAQK